MKIGEHSIQGIFKYSNSCKPEKDDLILYGGTLWVCEKNFPENAPGVVDGEYSIYLSPDFATVSEVIGLLTSDDPQWPEKAIPLSVMPEVFDRFFHGLTDKGIINETMTSITISDIVSDSSHAYGVYALSRDHRDVAGLVMKTDLSTDTGVSYGSPVFLKKYTYTSGTTTYVLVELSDYEVGSLWYRCYTKATGDTDYKVLSGWRVVSPSGEIKKMINKLVNQYQTRLNNLYGEYSILADNFRFTRLTFPTTESPIQKTILIGNTWFKGSKVERPVLVGAKDLDYTVVVILKNSVSEVCYSESITFPGSDSIRIRLPFTGVPGEVSLVIDSKNDSITFSVQGIPSGYEATISSIYYQDFYGKQY